METIIAVSILCLGVTIGSLISEKRELVETGRIGDICNIDPRKNNSQNESQKINTDSDLLNRCEEDEYWEIEKFGDTYYKVRREDADIGFFSDEELDREEVIGNKKDLYKYSHSEERYEYNK